MGNAQEKANLEETLQKFASPITQLSASIEVQITYTPTLSKSFSMPVIRTCKSLFQEAVRQAKILQCPEYQTIIALESGDKNEMIDYWLMKPEFKLDKFANDRPLLLQAVFKPKAHIFSEKHLTLSDFHFLKCIGKGGTSLVSLVRYMKTGHLFAIKQIPKPLLQDPRRLKQIMVERDVLNRLNCPFLADLICAFESENFLNFLMEYYPGGELFFHLKKIKFTEEIAKFYFAQIVFALEFLHSEKILYRDLKPENLILDLYGYIRLTDFGLCKRGLEDRELTHSFCGSPEYMAPEIINHAGHSYTVDFYTLGALLYEFTTGLPPYYSKNPKEILENINNGVLKLPDRLSDELKDLLRKLLTRNPEERIRDFGSLKQEKWLREVDWQGIYEKKIGAPIQLGLYKSNLHEEFVKIVISSDAMKEHQDFKREYPNFEYFSMKYQKHFEPLYKFEEEGTKKRLSSVPANKKSGNENNKSERKQSLIGCKLPEDREFGSPKNEKTLKKYSVKLPLKAKASFTKNCLLLNTTINGPLNRNLSIANCGQLTNRLVDQEKKKKVTTITIKTKKQKENINIHNASMLSPEKKTEPSFKEKKLTIMTKEKTYKKPESLEKKKEEVSSFASKKVNSEKKLVTAGSGINKTPVAGKMTKFLGNKTVMLKNWEALKENLNAGNISNMNAENQVKHIKIAKSYKIVSKN